MTPESSFEMNEMEFEKEIKGLDKKTFIEFRKKFREFSSEITRGKMSRKFSGNTNKSKPSEKSEDANLIGEHEVPEHNTPCIGLFSFKDQLRIISQKLHILKKEFERREISERVQERIKDMLRTPDEMLQIDETDFKEAVRNMECKEFKQYLEKYKSIFTPIISNRKKVAPLNAFPSGPTGFDKQQRDNIKIIKRWDIIEEEMMDRNKRSAAS